MILLDQTDIRILQLLQNDARLTNKEIADKLFISQDTVRSHIRNIYVKLHVNSKIEAINKVFK